MLPSPNFRALQLFSKLFLAAILVAGCGGGGGGGSGSDPAKSSFTAGPITGFGSVIVNGIRFDVSGASVADDEDQVHGEGDLKLGMVAEIQAGDISVDGTGSHSHARDVHFRSVIIGPVDAINTSTRLLIVLGQTVDVSNTTVFGDTLPNGPFTIQVGDVLEIFGMLNTNTGHYEATRIESKAGAAFFKLRGVVSNLDTRAQTFMIGGETISFDNLSGDRNPKLGNGMLVTAKLRTAQVNGVWSAIALRPGPRNMAEHDEVELKGRVTSVDSPTQFSVEGIGVDASGARFRPDGATIVLGAEVEVEGAARDGVIIATKVKIEDEDEDEHNGFELHGTVSMLDTNSQTFMLRGVRISYAGATFKDGSQSNLAEGSQVEVKAILSANGTGLVATIIEFEH